jgi:hypothetical protein
MAMICGMGEARSILLRLHGVWVGWSMALKGSRDAHYGIPPDISPAPYIRINTYIETQNVQPSIVARRLLS